MRFPQTFRYYLRYKRVLHVGSNTKVATNKYHKERLLGYPHTRGGRSHIFGLRLRSCSKFLNLDPAPVQTPATIDPTEIPQYFYLNHCKQIGGMASEGLSRSPPGDNQHNAPIA